MDLPTAVVWFLVVVNIAWAIFVVVVMANVLRFVLAATPFYDRENAKYQMALHERDRAKGIKSF